MIKWFAANNLVINLGKINIMKFITKNSSHSAFHIGYKEKYREETVNTKFLGLQINNHINWKNHIKEMIPKFSGTCYAISLVVHIATLTHSNQFTMHTFIQLYKMELSSGVILPTVGRFSLYKRKLSELWLVHNPEPLVEV